MQHLALVMDGNRRWAIKRGLQPWLGHREGVETVRRVMDFCLSKKISYLSLYLFSIENFRRSETEKNYLFDMIVNEPMKLLPECLEKNIRIRFIGDRELFPKHIKETIEYIEHKTKECAQLQVNLLFCYGARQEIIGGIKTLIHKIHAGELSVDEISDETFEQCLWTSDMPEPDLIIRTGGRKRLSNFLLYQAAYSELCFLDCLWPEITQVHLESAVNNFYQEQRNFGR